MKITDKKVLTKYLACFVMGDGSLTSLESPYLKKLGREYKLKNLIKNSCYKLKQLSTHKDLVDFQAEVIENITSVSVKTQPAYIDKRGYSIKEQLILSSKTHPFFTTMRQRLYLEGKKVVNPHDLNLLDAEFCAHLYMADGWIEEKQNKNGSWYIRSAIATHAYSYGDNLLIKQAIKEKLGVEFDIKRHKQKSGEYKFYLRNSKDNANRFLEAVYPFLLPSFEYKLGNQFVRSTPQAG